MAYSELIKDFERIRDYMRRFYVYGFMSRGEYDRKSARSYDNERRRVESWLGDYMSFRQDSDGKKVFLSVDSRAIDSNPLYNAFKAKSFTNGDITFHFCVLDLLQHGVELSIREITDGIFDKYLSNFDTAILPDESTVRKKLREYERLGIISGRKRGRELVFRRAECNIDTEAWKEAVTFYSQADPLGAIGAFIRDKYSSSHSCFGFKHNYILHALDSEILCDLLIAMNEKRCVEITVRNVRGGPEKKHTLFPVKIFISTQTGRQYLLGFHYLFGKPMFFRLDGIHRVIARAVEKQADKYSGWYGSFTENLWGVSTGVEFSLDHIEMTVHVSDGEDYIPTRLEREKRCGHVEMLDEHTYRFSADVYDATEMLPWLRTFIGRIVKLDCSNDYVTRTFADDLAAMNALYGGD